jgi:hypothetical protein
MSNITKNIDGDDINPSSADVDNETATGSLSADSADVTNEMSAGSVSADEKLSGPTASEGDVVTVESDPDTIPIYFDDETGEPLAPDLTEEI